MAFNASIRIEGAEGLQKFLANLPQEIAEEVDAVFEAGAMKVAQIAKQNAPKDEGIIANSISHKQAALMKWEVVSPRKYAVFQEFGTKKYKQIPAGLEGVANSYVKGEGGTFADLLKNITAWVKRKGISGTYSVKTRRRTGSQKNGQRMIEDLEVAYPIALNIARNGLKPKPSFFPAFNQVKPEIIQQTKQAISNHIK